MEKKLGKIQSVKFGHTGYQDACLGISFTLGDGGWGVCTDMSAWDWKMMECTKRCKWTDEQRFEQYAEIMKYVSELLADAKVDSVEKLKDIPIEATFDGMKLESFRILTEVI